MRILYGVSGVGLGHSTRAKEIIRFLKENNHKVLVFTYGEAYPMLRKEAEVFKINGIPLHFHKGKLVLSKTFYHAFRVQARCLHNRHGTDYITNL
jgi:UDP:flavonoid glycosyltransferase YjiC (YdhE family)